VRTDPAGPLRLPRGAERYVVLQRASYSSRLPARWRGGRFERDYRRYAAPTVERFRRPAIARRYTEELTAEYAELGPFLPATADAILDIGCGIGGIDVALSRHYEAMGQRPRVSLLDREGVSDVFYGFREDAAHYNSLDLARAFLALNGVPAASIDTIDVDAQGFPTDRTYDLVISLLSWGHHYPVHTYLDDVDRALSATGVVVLDVRRDAEGEDQLRQRFGRVEVVRHGRVSDRLALTR
jgi:SAM-dependent methyltransferase